MPVPVGGRTIPGTALTRKDPGRRAPSGIRRSTTYSGDPIVQWCVGAASRRAGPCTDWLASCRCSRVRNPPTAWKSSRRRRSAQFLRQGPAAPCGGDRSGPCGFSDGKAVGQGLRRLWHLRSRMGQRCTARGVVTRAGWHRSYRWKPSLRDCRRPRGGVAMVGHRGRIAPEGPLWHRRGEAVDPRFGLPVTGVHGIHEPRNGRRRRGAAGDTRSWGAGGPHASFSSQDRKRPRNLRLGSRRIRGTGRS